MLFRNAFLLTTVFFLCANSLTAQPGNPDPPDNTVPISGLFYLLAAGGILGVKKLRDIAKNRKD